MRVLLVNESEREREILAERLRAQGYQVDVASDAATGANMALGSPPDGVVADLWMQSISGVPLCRLLRSEPTTTEVPVVLCAEDEPRNRFWAERAGAAFVRKGRVGELVRTLARELRQLDGCDGLVKIASDIDVRDRIAQHLDAALFDSVIVSEVRALANSTALNRLFDGLAQLTAQVSSYRWLALSTLEPWQVAIHANPSCASESVVETRGALGLNEDVPVILVEDEDAMGEAPTGPPLLRDLRIGSTLIGRLAMAPVVEDRGDGRDAHLLDVISHELAGPLRMTLLMERAQRMAMTDPLTGLLNRRAFLEALSPRVEGALHGAAELALLLLDIDHFKQINDTRGHASGDLVLAAVGGMLGRFVREDDLVARWGGEEFVVALPGSDHTTGLSIAERLRETLAELELVDAEGRALAVTASIGLTTLGPGDDVDTLMRRADEAMYLAKAAGRNRVAHDREHSAAPADEPMPQRGILLEAGVRVGQKQPRPT